MLDGERHEILNHNGTDSWVPRREYRPKSPAVTTDCWELMLSTMPCLLKVPNTYFLRTGLYGHDLF